MSKTEQSIDAMMLDIGRNAKQATRALALAPTAQKDRALLAAAADMRAHASAILLANTKDMEAAEEKGISAAMLDRLALDEDRIEGIAAGLEAVATLPDPVGEVMADWERPNGLKFQRIRVPLGVIGIIYESRPNVTADAGALGLKAGNAVILRGGSESYHSSRAIHQCLVNGLTAADLPETAIQMVPTTDRAAVGAMLGGLDSAIDIIVPRGGKSLIARVQAEARVPVFAHLEGLCHVYVDRGADAQMAEDIVFNAKMRRTSICGAAETVLIDRAVADTHLAPIVVRLQTAGCEVRGDELVQQVNDRVIPATEDDWVTEYLEPIVSIKTVDGIDEAIAHINGYGSAHTDSIVTDDAGAADKFLAQIDSSIVLHNASTQYADGGEFGFGAEIGISTGRIHARGPVGLEQLTSFKYVVRGTGQTRP
ncbi:MAG: glutamate-5-semialdehyde dehydrogenase [Alphaproteobacteria bacterium]